MEGLASVIVALGTLTAAIGALVVAIMNARASTSAREKALLAAAAAETARIEAEAAKREIIVVHGEIMEVGKRIDGRLSELLALTEKSARAEGVIEGKATQRERTGDSAEHD